MNRRFGGITLYAYSAEELDLEIGEIRSGIRAVIAENGPLAPSMMRYLVAQRIKREIAQRVFSALLGSELKIGRLDGILCETENCKQFRIIVAVDAKSEFEGLLRSCLEIVLPMGNTAIASIRDRLYPGEKKGNWTRAYYLVATLARIGLIDFIDRFHIRKSEDAYNAICSIDKSLYAADRFRLG